MDTRTEPSEANALYHQNVSRCLAGTIGPSGISGPALDAAFERVNAALKRLQRQYQEASLPLLRIAEERDDIDAAGEALQRLSQDARTIVFFGTGGSGLGGKTLAQVSGWNIPGGANVYDRARPRTRFYDNLDPLTQLGALDLGDLAKTRFVVTSKSGGTTETLAQAITALSAVRAAGLEKQIPKMFLGITEPAEDGKSNGLRDLFEAYGIPLLDHPVDIGGRFSCLTNVGLLPALARGMNGHDVRRGANAVVLQLLSATSADTCPPAMGAAVALAAAKDCGTRNLAMMPYSDRLESFSDWFVQLWAESLGKGGSGTIPIATLGPRDQHSLLQLFMDGPNTFLFTVLRTDTAKLGPKIDPAIAAQASADYIGGKTIGAIIDAQSHAIVDALAEAGRPVRTIDIPSLDDPNIGGLLMHFMLETILTGFAMDVDPFDQPAVEVAKKLTRQNLQT